MVAQFGYGVLVISFLTALFAIGAAVYGYFKPSQRWVESARNAMMLVLPADHAFLPDLDLPDHHQSF